jgi:hypothetical protein
MATTSEQRIGWVLDEMRREHEARYGWHEEAMAETRAANVKHRGSLRNLVIIAALRPIIEFAILVVLIWKL